MRRPAAAVWIAAALVVCAQGALAFDRYVTYGYGADLGLYTQTILDAFHGAANQVEHGSHFLVHFSPIYFLIAPLLQLLRSPMTLEILQICACALTAPAIYLLARKRIAQPLAVLVALVVLFYPPLFSMALSEFHENAFVPATIAWLVWAIDERRFGWAALLAALALCTKEDEAVILALLGGAYLIVSMRRKDRAGAWFGASVAVASLAVLALYFDYIQPHSGGRYFVADFYLAHNADLPHGIAILSQRVTFLLEVFVPLLFLPFASRWLWLAVPGLIEVLSSRWPVTYTMGDHYAAVWIPYVLVAFALGVARVAAGDARRARTLVAICLGLCIADLIVASPTHWAHYYRLRTPRDAALDRIIAQVPRDAFVASFDEAYTHMSLDPNARIGMYVTPDYFVYDPHYRGVTWSASIVPRLAAAVCPGFMVPVASQDGVTLYKRVKPVPDLAYARAQGDPPSCLPHAAHS
ncbi:MAG: DUF2079 domain-containing protein [Candidatus Eremiobacteraeota bacterium]|nr:DUF2079 domain-containing protein [Candidatus Eremiobacteraeota bacterium]